MSFYKDLFSGGGFTLPFLVHIYSDDAAQNVYLINDTRDLVYNGTTYTATTFAFTPGSTGSNATLETEDIDSGNGIIDILENKYNFHADIIGVLLKSGTVEVIKTHKYQHANVTWNEKKISMSFIEDDRLQMTFPALIFNAYNNRGNS